MCSKSPEVKGELPRPENALRMFDVGVGLYAEGFSAYPFRPARTKNIFKGTFNRGSQPHHQNNPDQGMEEKECSTHMCFCAEISKPNRGYGG